MIPFSIFAVWLPKRDLSVSATEMAPSYFLFRLPKSSERIEGEETAQILWFSQDSFSYEKLEVRGTTSFTEQTEYWDCFCFTSETPAFLECLHKVTDQYMQMIRLKTMLEENEVPSHLLSYSIDPEVFEEMTLRPSSVSVNTASIGLMIDSPSACDRFLKQSFEDWFLSYQRRFHVTIDKESLRYLWLGNAFCKQLLPSPDKLRTMALKARAQLLEPVLVLPPLELSFQQECKALLRAFAEAALLMGEHRIEVVYEDIGLPLMAQELFKSEFPELAAEFTKGPLADKSPSDVRSRFHPGIRRDKKTPETVYAPFYPMNTALFCTLRAKIEQGERGRFSENRPNTAPCPRYCERERFDYPKGLDMVGVGNVLLAAKWEILSDPLELMQREKKGMKRLILFYPEVLSDD